MTHAPTQPAETDTVGIPAFVAHDRQLSELWTQAATAEQRSRLRAEDLKRYIEAARRNPDVALSTAQVERLEQAAKEARESLVVARLAVLKHEDGYRGWARYFLVTNVGGHIHSSTDCSTCRRDTEFSFLVSLSGLDKSAAVSSIGPILCSVCFPDAPVEQTTGVSNAASDGKVSRARAREIKREKALENALIEGDPDGFVKVENARLLRTISAAKSWLTDSYEWGHDHPSFRPSSVQAVAEALAARTGMSTEVVLKAAEARAAKRRR